MISIQAKDIAKSFGGAQILIKITFSLNYGDKVGLVGPNGAGKTTLFSCLTGQESIDSGKIMLGSDMELGFLRQENNFAPEESLEEVLLQSFDTVLTMRRDLSQLEEDMTNQAEQPNLLEKTMAKYSQLTEQYEQKGGYGIEAKVRQVAAGLGFSQEDLKRQVMLFSGGQQTRVKLGKLLLQEPSVLLLDEPTNHLDADAVEWLEGYLKSYPGTVIVVSHDRYFLDQFAEKILELESGKVDIFKGNYSRYKLLKAEKEAAELKVYQKQQDYISKTEAYIDKYRAGIKSKQARGRQKQLDRLDKMNKPENIRSLHDFNFQIRQNSGKRVLELKDIAHSFEQGVFLFKEVSGLVSQGEKVGIVGPNGVGKTTLLKVITGELVPAAGEIIYGSKVDIEYYSQQQEDLTLTNSVLQEIVQKTELTEYEAQNALGSFLFSGDDVFKLVGDLSGGEKSRLCLLKLFISRANLLIMDEPTNHLDIPAKEVLEHALKQFPGTVLLVSHDRYFLDQVTEKIWELTPGKLTEYLGNYSNYRWKKQQLIEIKQEQAKASEEDKMQSSAKLERKKEKELKRRRKELQEYASSLENEITELEERLESIGLDLAKPETYSDQEKAKELNQLYKELEEEIALKYEEWDQVLEKGSVAKLLFE